MIINEEKRKEFEQAAKPLMKWLSDNFHPHVKVIVDSIGAELSEGVATVAAVEAGESIEHWSRCAVYNMRAFPNGECNCNWPNEALAKPTDRRK